MVGFVQYKGSSLMSCFLGYKAAQTTLETPEQINSDEQSKIVYYKSNKPNYASKGAVTRKNLNAIKYEDLKNSGQFTW